VGRGWQHAVQSVWLAQYTALVGMAWAPHEWSAHFGFLRQQLVHSGDLQRATSSQTMHVLRVSAFKGR
jgi:hypothetical protein